MNKKIMFSFVLLSALSLNAKILWYSSIGYDNALQNGFNISENYDLSVKACFENPYNATDKIWDKYNRNDFKHINGNIIELCNYQQQTQLNQERYIVQCSNINKGFADLSNAQGWGTDLSNENGSQTSKAYASSVLDNNDKSLAYNSQNEINYNIINDTKMHDVYGSDGNKHEINIIKDAYSLYSTNTTGRIHLKNQGNAIGYLLDQTPIDDEQIKEFYNIIVGSQYKQLVSDNKHYQDVFNSVKGRSNDLKVLEKALLKNLKAIEYIGYLDYPIQWGNEGKCYTFDITNFDSVNISNNENIRKAVIRAKNFLYKPQDNYIFKTETREYSIHKNNKTRAGIYDTDNKEYKFSINLRATLGAANGKLSFIFYPDAKTLELNNKKIYLKDNKGANLAKRESANEYYLLANNSKPCKLSIDENNANLVLNQGSCNLDKNNIQIIEKIGDYERPIFQESGIDIIKGFISKNDTVANELKLRTAFVDNDTVIKNGKVNKDTKYGSAIYTTLAKKDFYVQLDTANNDDIFIDFNTNGNFSIVSAYDSNGIINKLDETNVCANKYPTKQMVLKLQANEPKQINNISYTQYQIVQENGKEVCKPIQNPNGGFDFQSNNFAIRPAEFKTGISKLTQEAALTKITSISSNDLAGFNDLAIGIANLNINFDGVDKNFVLLNNANTKISVLANDNRLNSSEARGVAEVDKNGMFNLMLNFPLATSAKISLAESNFTKNDKILALCDANSFDKTMANIQTNGKISCYIPMKNDIDIDFTSITKANNEEFTQCSDTASCDELSTAKKDKIGIRNPVYNKIMLGDKEALIYTLNLVSKNSDEKFVPTRFNDGFNLSINLENVGKLVVSEGSSKTINITADMLNQAFKKAFDELNENMKLTNIRTYKQDEANYKNTSAFSFEKHEIIPIQKIALDVRVDGNDLYDINYHKNYDVAYTSLVFNDILAKSNTITLEYPRDCDFGYYDLAAGELAFIKDNKLKLKNVINKINFTSDYTSTKISANTIINQSSLQYLKDSIKFKAKPAYEYLSNPKNIFTIEYK